MRDIISVAIMQPYFLPYIGYMQLIAQSDIFVFYDDVQYIDRGWVNRNRILLNGEPKLLTLPVTKGRQTDPINERRYRATDEDLRSTLNFVKLAYERAPQFGVVFPMIAEAMNFPDRGVGAYNANLIKTIAAYLELDTRFVFSSLLGVPTTLGRQERLIVTTQKLGGRRYVNSIGGTALYYQAPFVAEGIELKFLKPRVTPYRQYSDNFVPSLSILDALMFNTVDQVRFMLNDYDLVDDEK